MNVPVTFTEPRASAMNCAEAQGWFAALVDGRLALTERALVAAHLDRCAACRHEEARLAQHAAARRPVAPPRADLESLGAAVIAARVWVSRSATLLVARPTRLMQAGRRGVARCIADSAALRTRAALRLTAAARTLAASTEAARLALARSLDGGVILSRPSVRAVRAMLALALFALPCANGPQPYAAPVRSDPGTEVTWLWTSLAAGIWPSRPLEQTGGSPAMLSSPPVPTSEAVRGVSFRTAPSGGPGPSAFRVIGQLTTTDRTAAEPHFSALLARVSGAELGRRHRPAFTTVEVIVPRSRYDDFVQGLARIGSWRLDAARFPLPDAVHMSIRLRG
jgi:hypothetical protein